MEKLTISLILALSTMTACGSKQPDSEFKNIENNSTPTESDIAQAALKGAGFKVSNVVVTDSKNVFVNGFNCIHNATDWCLNGLFAGSITGKTKLLKFTNLAKSAHQECYVSFLDGQSLAKKNVRGIVIDECSPDSSIYVEGKVSLDSTRTFTKDYFEGVFE